MFPSGGDAMKARAAEQIVMVGDLGFRREDWALARVMWMHNYTREQIAETLGGCSVAHVADLVEVDGRGWV